MKILNPICSTGEGNFLETGGSNVIQLASKNEIRLSVSAMFHFAVDFLEGDPGPFDFGGIDK